MANTLHQMLVDSQSEPENVNGKTICGKSMEKPANVTTKREKSNKKSATSKKMAMPTYCLRSRSEVITEIPKKYNLRRKNTN